VIGNCRCAGMGSGRARSITRSRRGEHAWHLAARGNSENPNHCPATAPAPEPRPRHRPTNARDADRNHATLAGMEKVWREFVGGSLDGELIELPAGQFCFNLDDGADGHYEEYWLDKETGRWC
jgi:hypothetical protein